MTTDSITGKTLFRPEVWSHELLTAMRSNVFYGVTRDEYSRKGHSHVTPYTDAQLEARDKAITEWQRLTDELLAQDYLEYDPDGGPTPNEDTGSRTWVYDETEEEHAARVATLPERAEYVSIPVFTLESLNAIREHTTES